MTAETKDPAAFAAELSNAHSTPRYRGGWAPSIRALRAVGLDDRQIEAVIRSKWTRWAADESGSRHGYTPAKAIVAFVAKQGARRLAALTAESAPPPKPVTYLKPHAGNATGDLVVLVDAFCLLDERHFHTTDFSECRLDPLDAPEQINDGRMVCVPDGTGEKTTFQTMTRRDFYFYPRPA